MKKTILGCAILAITVFGTSCKKDEISLNGPEGPSLGRGGIGENGGDACINPVTTKLLIEKNGQNNGYSDYVGNISISNDGDSIAVTYDCIDGNVLKEVRIWAGPKSDAPVNSSGNPKFGQFLAANNSIPNLTSYTIKIPVSAIGIGNNGIIIAHAKTFKHNSESAWADGPLFSTKGKAKFVNYQACGGN